MAESNKNGKIKIKGELTARIIWVIGALMFALYAFSSFSSIGSEGESAVDCIKTGVGNSIYLLAFIVGIVYLFGRKSEKTAFIGAIFYAAAYIYGFVCDVTGGGRISAEDLTTMTLSCVVYVIFVVFTKIWATRQPAQAFSKCLKFWYLPAALLFLAGLIECFWTEFARPDGFLLDGFMVDFVTYIIVVLPVFTMLRVIKGRVTAARA